MFGFVLKVLAGARGHEHPTRSPPALLSRRRTPSGRGR